MAESNNDRTAALKGEKIQASAGLLTAYVGPNAAHRELRTALANAKAIAYILIDGDAKVLKAFLEQAEEIKRQAKGADYAFGVGGRATATTLQMSVHLTGGEIDLIAGARGGFISLTLGLVYREVYRAFEPTWSPYSKKSDCVTSASSLAIAIFLTRKPYGQLAKMSCIGSSSKNGRSN